MKFSRYNSIENHYRQKYIEIVREYGFDKPGTRWIAHEKIHGANFSFITDGTVLSIASRNNLVGGDFYHCQPVVDKYKEAILNLKGIHYPEAKQIQVYGELFGPGIQSGVFYGENKEFMAFDVAVDGEIQEWSFVAGLLAYYKIPTPPALGVFESMDEGLALDEIFVSAVIDKLYPEHIGVSEYELGENDAEGFVLKPLEPLYLGNGDRVLFKKKHPKFAEKKNKKKKPSGEVNPWIDIADQYVNENRMNAVVSKYGEVTQRDFGKIIKLMNEDVLEDMVKDEEIPAGWKKSEEHKLVGKGVSAAVSRFLKANLLHKI